MKDNRLAGKAAIITGAGSGIGAATAQLFAREGALVMLTDLQADKLKAVTDQIRREGGNAFFTEQDVSKEEDWQKVVNETLRLFKRIDILVNNAGITGNLLAPLAERSVAEFQRVLSVNLTGQFIGIRAVAPHMGPGCSIVNVSSIAGITGNAGGNAYTASKGGARMLSKGAAIELAKLGIRVNSLHPGFVETPMTSEMQGALDFRKMALDATPLNRGASPEELAKSILFLAGDDSSFMTGAELIVDGGFTAF
jgi:NAD(P)-dependent dehydrogenase (short-subunit alcohol dehydrogenase family)